MPPILPRAIQAPVVADAKRIIYVTNKKEALEEFKVWKERYKLRGQVI